MRTMRKAPRKLERTRAKYERRWLRRGCCAVCGRPRGIVKRQGLGYRRSKRFCRYHLEKNRVYQQEFRETA